MSRLSRYLLMEMPRIVAACSALSTVTLGKPPRTDCAGIIAGVLRELGDAPGPAAGANDHRGANASADALEVLRTYACIRSAVSTLIVTDSKGATSGHAEALVAFNEALDRVLEVDVRVSLQRSQQTQDLFVAMLAHDLRSPLHAILMSTSFLQRTLPLPEDRAQVVRRIASSGERMERLVVDLLEYARIRMQSGVPLHTTECALEDVVRSAVDELSPSYPDRTILHSVDGDTAGRWDRERIAQVISNLLSNALEHSPNDAPISIMTTGDGEQVRLSICNQGPAMPAGLDRMLLEPGPDAQPGVPYVSERGVRLGLMIVHEIVAAHGGSMRAHSENGTTRFDVTLPRCARSSESAMPGAARADA